jgi:hypothetical protein
VVAIVEDDLEHRARAVSGAIAVEDPRKMVVGLGTKADAARAECPCGDDFHTVCPSTVSQSADHVPMCASTMWLSSSSCTRRARRRGSRATSSAYGVRRSPFALLCRGGTAVSGSGSRGCESASEGNAAGEGNRRVQRAHASDYRAYRWRREGAVCDRSEPPPSQQGVTAPTRRSVCGACTHRVP